MSEKDQDASRVLDLHLRADALRAVAEAVKDPECYAALMRLVGCYEAMAKGAEAALRAPDEAGAVHIDSTASTAAGTLSSSGMNSSPITSL